VAEGRRTDTTSLIALVIVLVLFSGGCLGTENEVLDPTVLIAGGEALFTSEGCVNCHGERGQGIIGPRLNKGALLETLPSCDEQLRWVSLGSAKWARDVGATYGSSAKPVRGGMPGFGSRLDPAQISQVVSFTRSVFGGADAADVADDCDG
jgi:mono/diheme cytochrome c family protein